MNWGEGVRGLLGRRFRLAGAIAALLMLLGIAAGANYPALRDLEGHWARSFVTALAGRRIATGLPDGTFGPDRPITRAEAARLFAVALGVANEPGLRVTRFVDLHGHWAQADVEAMAEMGLVKGYPDGRFAPERPVTRIELVALAARAAGLSSTRSLASFPVTFLDMAAVPPWAVLEMAAAAADGLLNDLFGRTLAPDQPATRAEAAVLAGRSAARQGALFALTGVVEQWDAAQRRLTLQLRSNERRQLLIPPEAMTFRDGLPALDFRPLDQVWVVQGADGAVYQVEARYGSLIGQMARIQGGELRFMPQGSLALVSVPLAPDTAVFVNGQSAPLGAVDGAGVVFVVLDAESGAARVIDAVRYTDAGQLTRMQGADVTLVTIGDALRTYRLAPDTIIYAGGERAGPGALRPGQQVWVHAVDGRITYLQVAAAADQGR